MNETIREVYLRCFGLNGYELPVALFEKILSECSDLDTFFNACPSFFSFFIWINYELLNDEYQLIVYYEEGVFIKIIEDWPQFKADFMDTGKRKDCIFVEGVLFEMDILEMIEACRSVFQEALLVLKEELQKDDWPAIFMTPLRRAFQK